MERCKGCKRILWLWQFTYILPDGGGAHKLCGWILIALGLQQELDELKKTYDKKD